MIKLIELDYVKNEYISYRLENIPENSSSLVDGDYRSKESDIYEVLSILLQLDNVEILAKKQRKVLLADNYKHILKADELKEFKFAPFAHQVDGINFGLGKEKWLLLDSMGLG